mgnify:CR=1 FL=1
MVDSTGAGKGDTYRPVDKQKYEENYERIFGKPPEKEDSED